MSDSSKESESHDAAQRLVTRMVGELRLEVEEKELQHIVASMLNSGLSPRCWKKEIAKIYRTQIS